MDNKNFYIIFMLSWWQELLVILNDQQKELSLPVLQKMIKNALNLLFNEIN